MREDISRKQHKSARVRKGQKRERMVAESAIEKKGEVNGGN